LPSTPDARPRCNGSDNTKACKSATDLWVEGVALAVNSHGVRLRRGAIRCATLAREHQQVALLDAAAHQCCAAKRQGPELDASVSCALAMLQHGCPARAKAAAAASSRRILIPLRCLTHRRGLCRSATAAAPLRQCRSPPPKWPSASTPSRCRQPACIYVAINPGLIRSLSHNVWHDMQGYGRPCMCSFAASLHCNVQELVLAHID
jgi:hypothetical protein